MSLGDTLRAAREACGITTSELAARTHMLVQIVEGLENEDFRRIPAPIYGRGFVKLYCEAVGIDHAPLQKEFMELFNKPKDAVAEVIAPPAVRPVAPPVAPSAEQPAEAPAEPSEEVSAEQPAETDFGELFASPANRAPQPAPIRRPADFETPVSPNPPPKRSYGDIFGQAYAGETESAKLSAAEKFRNTMSNVSSGVFSNVQKLPRNMGRIIAVSLCAVLTVALIAWGVAELYKATSPDAGDSAEKPAAAAKGSGKQAEAKPAEKKAVEKTAEKSVPSVKPGGLKSSGIEIPALYID